MLQLSFFYSTNVHVRCVEISILPQTQKTLLVVLATTFLLQVYMVGCRLASPWLDKAKVARQGVFALLSDTLFLVESLCTAHTCDLRTSTDCHTTSMQ